MSFHSYSPIFVIFGENVFLLQLIFSGIHIQYIQSTEKLCCVCLHDHGEQKPRASWLRTELLLSALCDCGV